MHGSRRFFAATGVLLLLVGLAVLRRATAPPALHSLEGSALGTGWSVRIDGDVDPEQLAAARAVIEARLERVDALMSTFDTASALSRFNRLATTEPVELDPEVIEVLERAKVVSERSGGAFDPTVGPLVDAWGFGPSVVPPAAPDSSRLAELRERVGFTGIEIDVETGTVSKAHPLAQLDLSGIAKGWAAERVAEDLRALGHERLLVDVGGELRAVGTRRDGSPWTVGVERPDDDPGVWGTIELTDMGVATSGDYRNWFEDGGVRWAHIIDPHTGWAVPVRWSSVTVVHRDAAIADAWATALVVLGPDGGYEVARREGVAALFVTREASGGLEAQLTPALRDGFVVREAP